MLKIYMNNWIWWDDEDYDDDDEDKNMMITYKEYEIGKQDQIFENIWYEPIHRVIRMTLISETMHKLYSPQNICWPDTSSQALKLRLFDVSKLYPVTYWVTDWCKK